MTKKITLNVDIKGLTGKRQEAIQELHDLRQTSKVINFAILEAIKWLHQQAETVDYDELNDIAAMSSTALSCTSHDAILLAARFHLLLGNVDEEEKHLATSISDRLNNFAKRSEFLEKNTIKGWFLLQNEDQCDDAEFMDVIKDSEKFNSTEILDTLMLIAKSVLEFDKSTDSVIISANLTHTFLLFFLL